MPLAPATDIDGYQVIAPLGAGGMGEVYRARDPALKRDVAIKVLPSSVAREPARLQRFQQEAQAAAALNHPNILAVYRFGLYSGSPYIVSELLEGSTLRQLLEHGPLPVRKAIDYAIQIAHGLAAAHEQNIIHRDLKPENLFVTREGRVKILDFGLAKLIQRSPASGSDASTLAEATEPGMVMGTVGYMSPEQVRGAEVDHRSDIFAFGAILYEMLSGSRAFRKPTSAETMTAILNDDPPELSRLALAIPPALQRIVHRCMEKSPAQRFHSASDLAFALEALSDYGSSQSAERPPSTQPPAAIAADASRRWAFRPFLFALAAMLLILLGALYVMHRNSKAGQAAEPENQDVRVSPLTTLPGYVGAPALSPDGKQVVFAWDGGRNAAKSMFDLYIKVIGAERIEQLTHQPAEAVIPAWSPDGSTIAFIRSNGTERGIFTMSVLGGPERKLDAFTDDLYGNASSLSWSADGRQLVYGAKNALRLLTVETGETRTIERPQQCKSTYLPVFSPDGKSIAFLCEATSGAVDLYRISPKGEQAKNLHMFVGEPLGIAWSGDGQRIILADNGGLLEIGANGGQPRRLSFAQTAVSQDEQIASRGNRLVYVQLQDNVNIWRVDLKSGTTRSLLAPTSRDQAGPAISPDGKRIAFESDRSGSQEVWMTNLDGSDAVQLSAFHALTGSPQWSPDGRRIVFDSRASGEAALYLVDPSTTLPKRISTNGIPGSVPTWSVDGKWIYFTTVSSQQNEHDSIYKVALEGGTPELVTRTHGYKVQESRDGRVLYFYAGDTNAPIWVLDKATGQEQPLKGMPDVGFPTDWVVGSKGIFYTDSTSSPATVAFYEFSSARVTRRFPIEKQFVIWGGLALSPDETWIAYPESDTRGSDLMMADGVR